LIVNGPFRSHCLHKLLLYYKAIAFLFHIFSLAGFDDESKHGWNQQLCVCGRHISRKDCETYTQHADHTILSMQITPENAVEKTGMLPDVILNEK